MKLIESSFLKVGHAVFAVEFALLIKKNYGNSLVTSLIDNNCFNADFFVQVLFLLTASCFLTLDGLTKVMYLHNYWFPQHVSTALFLGISINPPEAKFNSLDESIHANSKTMQMLGYFEEKAKKTCRLRGPQTWRYPNI